MTTNIIIPKISNNHNDSFWYGNKVICYVEHKNRKIIISSCGDIRMSFNDEDVTIYKNEQAIDNALYRKLCDADLQKHIFFYSNYFDFIYQLNNDSNRIVDIEADECFTYDDAIQYAQQTILDDEYWTSLNF